MNVSCQYLQIPHEMCREIVLSVLLYSIEDSNIILQGTSKSHDLVKLKTLAKDYKSKVGELKLQVRGRVDRQTDRQTVRCTIAI
jgi:hypothetical protein